MNEQNVCSSVQHRKHTFNVILFLKAISNMIINDDYRSKS